MSIKKSPKIPNLFNCEKCDYNTSNKKDYSKHLLTRKHAHRTTLNTLEQDDNTQNNFICKYCNKVYAARNSLWYHESKCKKSPKSPKNMKKSPDANGAIIEPASVQLLINEHKELINENKDFKNIMMELVKSNTELQKQMLDVCKNTNTTIHNTNQSHNKTFNLQFFLNEQCKDAMNLMDFVNTFQLQFSDLERIGEVGYVEGISNIIIDKLNELDIYKRPIHCSDAKREIMYVKENDVWTKENANNDKLRLAIKHITKKNTDMIRPWANKHPGILNSDHRLNDQYQEIIIEAMGGKNNHTMKEGENKIIKKISKMVLIDKC